jgi:hypothetical protein
MWRAGQFGLDEHRPDKLGVIFETQFSEPLNRTVVMVREMWAGAASGKANYYVKQFAQKDLVHVFKYQEKMLIDIMGPEELMREAIEWNDRNK